MRGLLHPFTKALYEQDGNGNVQVTDGETIGVFTTNGQWISGELLEADPHLCGWVGGPIIGNHRLAPLTQDQSLTQDQ